MSPHYLILISQVVTTPEDESMTINLVKIDTHTTRICTLYDYHFQLIITVRWLNIINVNIVTV